MSTITDLTNEPTFPLELHTRGVREGTDRPPVVEAYTTGEQCIAIHEPNSGAPGWTVTHIPSGCRMFEFLGDIEIGRRWVRFFVAGIGVDRILAWEYNEDAQATFGVDTQHVEDIARRAGEYAYGEEQQP
jgi:hypothetical protein